MSKKKSTFYTQAKTSMLCENPDPNYARLFGRYSLLAKNRYRWSNLPDGIESRHIEEYLFEHGQAVFYEDPALGLLVLPASDTGQRNVYGEPLSVLATGYGYQKQVNIRKDEEVVLIRNNDDSLPTIRDIFHYVDRINELEFAIQRNLDQQNSPYMFICNKNTEFAVKNIMNKIRNKEDAIFLDKTLTETGEVGVMKEDISKPYIGDELLKHKLELEKELLTLLGLNTVINKESGMADTELNSNNDHIKMALEIEYNTRVKAKEAINKRFGLNVEVEKIIEDLEEGGEVENGKLHVRTAPDSGNE